MPDFAVASSKRIAPGAGVGGACPSKETEDESRRNPRIGLVMLVPSRGAVRGCAGHVGGRGGLQQDHGNSILRRGFRAGVASHTGTLLAAAHPEKSRFALQGFSGAVQQFDLQRLLGGNLNEERTVALDGSRTKQSRVARAIARVV